MSKIKLTGYDLGGSECPLGLDYTVIDIVSPEEAGTTEVCDQGSVSDLDFIRSDLRRPNWSKGLKKRPKINVGAVLRYLNEDGPWAEVGGHLTGQPVKTDRFEQFGKELSKVWDDKTSGNQITFRDHLVLIEYVLLGLITGRDPDQVTVKIDLNEGPDEDLPATWNVTVTVN